MPFKLIQIIVPLYNHFRTLADNVIDASSGWMQTNLDIDTDAHPDSLSV